MGVLFVKAPDRFFFVGFVCILSLFDFKPATKFVFFFLIIFSVFFVNGK